MRLNIIENLENHNKNFVDIKAYSEYVFERMPEEEVDDERFKEVISEAYCKFVKDDRLQKLYKVMTREKKEFKGIYDKASDSEKHQLLDLYCLCHMASEWQDYKQIYSFDVDTMAMLAETKQEISNEILSSLKLPYNNFAIENEFEFESGVVDSLLFKRNESKKGVEFAFYLFNKDDKARFKHQFLELKLYGRDINEFLASLEKEARDFYKLIFNMLMYLAQPKVEIFKTRNQVKERKNAKSFYGIAYEKNDVGYTLGQAIRNYKVRYQSAESHNKTGGIKKPHLRAGHFHHYWVGKGRKDLIVKFVEPTFIKGSSIKKPVLHKVKQ